jgi:hypothetical protein
LLLNSGADAAIKNWGDKTAMQLAQDRGQKDVVAVLEQAAKAAPK